MTAIVGVYCKDGVVIGSDSSTTFTIGQIGIIEQPTKKIDIIGDNVIVAGTGQVGLGQRFCAVVRKAYEDRIFNKSPIEIGKILCANGRQDFASTGVTMDSYGALVAFTTPQRFHLFEFATHDFQPEQKTDRIWYVSMGSGQMITDPFLAFIRQVFWNNGVPTIQEAMFAVTWTLDHAISVNAGGINGPIQMAVLEKNSNERLKARFVREDELSEHRQNIYEAISLLREYRLHHQVDTDVPEVPKP